LATLAGEALRREHRVPVALPLSGKSLDNLLERLGTVPIADFPVVVIPTDDPAMFETAEALLAKDYAIEAVIGSMAETSDPAPAARRAAIVRAAYRIHVARARTAREAVASQAREPSRETTDA
jgi:hypothetical protein